MALHPIRPRPDVVGRYMGRLMAQQQLAQNRERFAFSKQQAAGAAARDMRDFEFRQRQQLINQRLAAVQEEGLQWQREKGTPEYQALITRSKILAEIEAEATDPMMIEKLRGMRLENDQNVYEMSKVPVYGEEARRLGVEAETRYFPLADPTTPGASKGLGVSFAPREAVVAMRKDLAGERTRAAKSAPVTIGADDPLYDKLSVFPKDAGGDITLPADVLTSIRGAHAKRDDALFSKSMRLGFATTLYKQFDDVEKFAIGGGKRSDESDATYREIFGKDPPARTGFWGELTEFEIGDNEHLFWSNWDDTERWQYVDWYVQRHGPAVMGRREQEGAAPGQVGAPDKRLEPYWDKLSEEDRAEARQALSEDPDNIDAILKILRGQGK